MTERAEHRPVRVLDERALEDVPINLRVVIRSIAGFRRSEVLDALNWIKEWERG